MDGSPKITTAIERGLHTLTSAGTNAAPKDVAAAAGFDSTLNPKERRALKAATKWVRGGFESKRTDTVMNGLVVLAHVGLNSKGKTISKLLGCDKLTPKERYGIKAAADWIFEVQIYDVLVGDGCDDDT